MKCFQHIPLFPLCVGVLQSGSLHCGELGVEGRRVGLVRGGENGVCGDVLGVGDVVCCGCCELHVEGCRVGLVCGGENGACVQRSVDIGP